MKNLLPAMILVFGLLTTLKPIVAAPSATKNASFAAFDRRAKAGERLNVAFFGASLTWGANASDPQKTSYRADVARKFEAAYPRAHFRFIDGAIGGTGSQLGVFRLQRDVLRYHPDLVFLDFSANDDIYSEDPETLASYESLVRRVITQAHAPVVQVIFPFEWNVKNADLQKMKRRDAHLLISRAYNTAVGDAIKLGIERVRSGETTLKKIWPIDGIHPGDSGYALFADAAWQGYRDGVTKNLVCAAPEKMIHAPTYMTNKRVRISSLGPLPQGWRVGIPNRSSAWYDGLMSRWLDDETIASNRHTEIGADGKKTLVPQMVEPLKVNFRGTMVLLFGEETLKSGQYEIKIDGKAAADANDATKDAVFSASGVRFGGNRQHAQVVASGLAPDVEHTLEIIPKFPDDTETELRLESICVAGPGADVSRAEP